jgi:RimJ/RimL family protein N-acetyltransferase
MIEPLSRATREPTLRYLARSPYLNVFLSHVVMHDPAPPAQRSIAVALDHDAVVGVAYWGRQIALAAEPSTIEEFAEYGRTRRGERMIVGARETVSAYWKAVRDWHTPPRLVRDRQLVMVIDRSHLRPYERRTVVRPAAAGDLNAVADGSAQMVRQELEYDPRRGSPEFAAGIRQMIERKLWWVGSVDGRLCFLCNVGPWCDRTMQLQGIWTPPAMRGRGLATASLAAICDRLLDVSPTLSLYVNDFNTGAIALYHRVGFEHVGDFQTMLF